LDRRCCGNPEVSQYLKEEVVDTNGGEDSCVFTGRGGELLKFDVIKGDEEFWDLRPIVKKRDELSKVRSPEATELSEKVYLLSLQKDAKWRGLKERENGKWLRVWPLKFEHRDDAYSDVFVSGDDSRVYTNCKTEFFVVEVLTPLAEELLLEMARFVIDRYDDLTARPRCLRG
jgi:hypothetical protein